MKAYMMGAVVLMAAGCASNQNDMSPSFGDAFAANAAAQIVDPTPAEGAPEGDGAAADLAILRYKTDTVKQGDSGAFTPEGETTEE